MAAVTSPLVLYFKFLLLVTIFCCVYGKTLNPCQNYASTNKENIRNCLQDNNNNSNNTYLSNINVSSSRNALHGSSAIPTSDDDDDNDRVDVIDGQLVIGSDNQWMQNSPTYDDLLTILVQSIGGAKISRTNNDTTINISFKMDPTSEESDSEVSARKMSKHMNNMLQYMLVPGFLMAGILPWIMPKLQMIVMLLSMINNMAFTSALFALVRSYVFDQEPAEHVIYINQGYKNKHWN